MSERCDCGRGWFNPDEYRSCYDCFLDRSEGYASCIYCGRWHSMLYASCFKCRRRYRDEAAWSLRQYVLWRDGYTCNWCGTHDDLQVDHLKPCRQKGNAMPWNLQVLCGDCNRLKGDEWYPHSRWWKRRLELFEYYFYWGRSWLDGDQRRFLRQEVEWLRKGVAA